MSNLATHLGKLERGIRKGASEATSLAGKVSLVGGVKDGVVPELLGFSPFFSSLQCPAPPCPDLQNREQHQEICR